MSWVKTTISRPSLVSRVILFSLIWWILAGAAAPSWWIGVPAVLLAVIASIALIPPVPLVWLGFIRFVPFFFVRSLLGGADVAWRALHPAMPIAPDLIEYRLRIPPGPARVFMANTVSLLPGTLSAEIDANCLRVHVLDGRKDVLSELAAVEQSVARMFGTPMGHAIGGD